MTNDNDRCEWVNVSSVTSSPGFSRTKSSRKMVVYAHMCACVCVCVRFFGVTLDYFKSLRKKLGALESL